jgi:hypothetical protein
VPIGAAQDELQAISADAGATPNVDPRSPTEVVNLAERITDGAAATIQQRQRSAKVLAHSCGWRRASRRHRLPR